jgi:Prokaryotic homologs of the JAB domain
LDPAAEVETRALMEERGLAAVGWYHSHPIFAPRPSAKDNENQRNYQALFRCRETRMEPFLGAIVGPYDLALPDEVRGGGGSGKTWQNTRPEKLAM